VARLLPEEVRTPKDEAATARLPKVIEDIPNDFDVNY